ncbi:uncharacterized protein ATC70_010780 [Mucor velutinosus]|uniref:Uncharacterized protein n=1 Tax=Mucor velutinosus TaxID=708070 RepID=A0AAN7DET8_9FUNG|nr:hypothetical protein ATC70_010780 [Mucor velutinosus]
MSINFFFRTSAKEWDITEAIIYYDQNNSTSETSLHQLLLTIKNDLKSIGKTQASLNRYVLKAIRQVDKLLQLRCLVATRSDPQALENEKTPTVNNINNISQNEQVNIAGVNNIAMSQPTETDVGEGSSIYNINSPSAPVERPHKPKLRKLQIEALNQVIHFGTSFSQDHSSSKILYNQYKDEQKENRSLRSLGLFDYVVDLLDSETNYESFVEEMWISKLSETQDSRKESFLNIIKYSLTTFHLVCRSPPVNISNHERTHFVENVMPSLLALEKLLDFIEFKWCESEFISSKMLNQKNLDYDLRSTTCKYIDALGSLTTLNNMELIIVEASSGQLKENTVHSIEDTLKILECGISSLRKEAAHYNGASLSTFMKLKVYGIHVIKSQVTLSEISFDDENHWKCIELRRAKLPTAWRDRIGLLQYMELLATLYNACHENQKIQKQLIKEDVGLIPFSGPTIGSVIKDN